LYTASTWKVSLVKQSERYTSTKLFINAGHDHGDVVKGFVISIAGKIRDTPHDLDGETESTLLVRKRMEY
jgi:hypothetical protein